MSAFEASLDFAKKLDAQDPLRGIRDRFHVPQGLYFVGNSLGLQPKKAREYVEQELSDWEKLAIEGHLAGKTPWYSYHECLTESTARLVGAKPSEVVVMNALTVNLHLMLISFYRPTKERFRILVEGGAFPSDQYAVAAHAKLHGLNPRDVIVELKPRAGETSLRHDDIVATIAREGTKLAVVLLGDVNYLTGQAFNLKDLARVSHEAGAYFGVDLAHGAGNLKLALHDDKVDFAVWCSYKYLNAGPGAVAGCFVHENHAERFDWPRLAGWWGHDKQNRFQMGADFVPMAGAEGWQISNPPILQMAALRASMEIFDEVGMTAVREKGDRLTGFLEYLINQMPGKPFQIITPKERGSHLSFNVGPNGKALVTKLKDEGVHCDFREPGVMRAAPVALYNTFEDVFRFAELLTKYGK